jgi:crotonobetainyl-CoA:carnitine CoA-transferase CaiB-like acyl-CoA transferase
VSRAAKAAVNYVDFVTAISATVGVLAALLERTRTGRGRLVEASLLSSALTVANGPLLEQAVIAPDRVASGNRSQLSGPSDAFATRDGWLLVQVVGGPLFERWAKAVGARELLTDPRFATDIERGRNGAVLSERMSRWCAERTSQEALDAMNAAGVPAAPVLSPRQALEHRQVLESELLVPTAFDGLATAVPLAAPPFSIGAHAATVRGSAPKLGQHTDEILASLGYSEAQIADLRKMGAV